MDQDEAARGCHEGTARGWACSCVCEEEEDVTATNWLICLLVGHRGDFNRYSRIGLKRTCERCSVRLRWNGGWWERERASLS